MDLEQLNFQLKEKKEELNKALSTFILNPNIYKLTLEIKKLEEQINQLEDKENK